MTDPRRPIPVEKLLEVVRGCRAMLDTIDQKLTEAASDTTASPEQIQQKTADAFQLARLTQQSLDATLEIWRAQEDLAAALGGDPTEPKN